MSEIVERYLLLGMRLGRHVDGLVDAYYGPGGLAEEARGGDPVDPNELAAEADALAALVDRDSWLGDQLRGLRTYAGILAGEKRSYADEVEGCHGVRPVHVPEERFAAAHEQLERLLPGDGPLVERYEAWRSRQTVPPERVDGALGALVRELRGWTKRASGCLAARRFRSKPSRTSRGSRSTTTSAHCAAGSQ